MCGYRYGVYEARGLNSGLVARAAARFARYSSAAAILIASRDNDAACAWYRSAGRTFKRGGRGGSGSS